MLTGERVHGEIDVPDGETMEVTERIVTRGLTVKGDLKFNDSDKIG